jgi:hypothetical protein
MAIVDIEVLVVVSLIFHLIVFFVSKRICSLIRKINVIIFIFTDEASEITGDASSSTISTGPKYRDWAAQVESEEADHSADNLSQPNSLPVDPAGRGRRGQRRRNKSLLIIVC